MLKRFAVASGVSANAGPCGGRWVTWRWLSTAGAAHGGGGTSSDASAAAVPHEANAGPHPAASATTTTGAEDTAVSASSSNALGVQRVVDAEIVAEKTDPRIAKAMAKAEAKARELANAARDGDKSAISPRKVRFLSPADNLAVEFQKYAAQFQQDGPFVGSKVKDIVPDSVDGRKRREIMRVPQFKMPWQGYETSFRRLPEGYKLPNEWELRMHYPMRSKLHIEWGDAHCADLNSMDVDMDPLPIKFGMLLPPGYDPQQQYPYMVALPDAKGLEIDFEDMCANMFERPIYQEGLRQHKWVVFAPMINMKHSIMFPIEGVVARFCDWVTSNYNVEGGRVHLFGKGLGGYTALRTCLENADVAISCTALLGRLSSPFRPMERPMEKMKNLSGTHILMIVPGGMRKLEYAYKFKGMADAHNILPPVRCIHYAEVRDAQSYYAMNPYEFFNHLQYFRQNNFLKALKAPTASEEDDYFHHIDPDAPQPSAAPASDAPASTATG